MTTRQIESRAQDEAVRVYRDRFGYPRLEQPSDRRADAIGIACLMGAMVGLWWVAWLIVQ